MPSAREEGFAETIYAVVVGLAEMPSAREDGLHSYWLGYEVFLATCELFMTGLKVTMVSCRVCCINCKELGPWFVTVLRNMSSRCVSCEIQCLRTAFLNLCELIRQWHGAILLWYDIIFLWHDIIGVRYGAISFRCKTSCSRILRDIILLWYDIIGGRNDIT